MSNASQDSQQTFEVRLTPSDIAFLESEADLNQSSLQDVIHDAIKMYRHRANELRQELGESCCGGGCCGENCC